MKKIFSLLVTLAMLFTFIPSSPALAESSAKLTQAQALEITKTKLNLVTDGYNFNGSYQEDANGKKTYSFNWESKKQPGGSINVSIDADTGEILNFYQWDYTNSTAGRIPKYPKSSAQDAAEALIKKLEPDRFKEMCLTDDTQNVNYSSDTYDFKYIRKVNGIPFDSNGVSISIDKNTLKVRSYNFSWNDETLPDPSKAMNIEDAKKIFKDKLGIELACNLIYRYDTKTKKVILVYRLKNGSSPIDAISGEIINNPSIYADGKMYDMSGGKGASSTTPEEQEVLDETNKYISKDNAVVAVKKLIDISDKYTLNGAGLYYDEMTGLASWNLSWQYNDNNNSYGYISASVNALSGEVFDFSINGSEYDNEKDDAAKISVDEAKIIADDFVKAQQPTKFEKVELRNTNDSVSMGKEPVSSYYQFYYIRKETDSFNTFTCPFANFSVYVSAYTGKVMRYSMTWPEIELPSTEGAKTLDNAYNNLFSKVNLTLKYVLYNEDGKSTPQIKLAYVLDSYSGMFDAKTGVILDSNGDPVKDYKPVVFTDIKGNASENDIKLLQELGVIRDQDTKFRPNDKILQKDFIKMLVLSSDPYSYVSDDSYDKYYETAIQRNIISTAEKNPDSTVTRQQAARMILRTMGFGYIANLSNIYILPFKDAKYIGSSYKGYVAIASGLKILVPKSGYFYPTQNLTRGQAATCLINYLRLNPQQ